MDPVAQVALVVVLAVLLFSYSEDGGPPAQVSRAPWEAGPMITMMTLALMILFLFGRAMIETIIWMKGGQ